MSEGAYRDGEEATLQVLEQLAARALAREACVDPRAMRFLGDDGIRLNESRSRVDALAREDAEPLAQIEALERYLALLDEVVARLPALGRALTAPRPGFPELKMFIGYKQVDQFSHMPMWVGASFRNVERFIIHFDLDFRAWSMNTPHRRGFKVEFHHHGVPILLGCEKELSWDSTMVTDEHSVMATRVARGTLDVAVVPERLHHTLLYKPLGLVHDMRVGDDRFDHEFLVQAEDDEALAVVSQRVQRGLLKLKETESPQLLVERGDASLHWFSEPSHDLIRAAIPVLQALRGEATKLA